jgi:putative SOS response-associated peptidase YedK
MLHPAMCCRYLLLREDLTEVFEGFGLTAPSEFVSRYNLAPGEFIPAVRSTAPGAKPEGARFSWGLLPAWAPADRGTSRPVNARAETLGTKPTFREAFRTRRCLLPASGFYEWESRGGAGKPWLFRAPGARPFCLAGLWESRRLPDGREFETCAIVTTEANEVVRPIHDRMAVIIAPADFERWLDPRVRRPEDLAPLLRPAATAFLSATRVGPRVNNAAHDDEGCLQPPALSEESAGSLQFNLELG